MVKEKSNKTKKETKQNFSHVNYPVGDFLIKLKNASMVGHKSVTYPKSSLVINVSKALVRSGFLSNVTENDSQVEVLITFKNKEPLITDIHLVSKPGLRVYIKLVDLAARKSPSQLLLSTQKGILTSKEAVKQKFGGEIIAEIL